MGGRKRVFGTLHWDILWKDDLNHVICDYLNRELRSIDKIVHWQVISIGIFGVQNSLELPRCALLKSCLFPYVCFQIPPHICLFSDRFNYTFQIMGTYGIDNSILWSSSLPLHLYATQTFWSMNIEIHVYQVFVLYCYISKTSVRVMIIVYVRVL